MKKTILGRADLESHRLDQSAAAWLAGVANSTLRDRAFEIAPDETGRYSVLQVARWIVKRNEDARSDDAKAKARLELQKLDNIVRGKDAEFKRKTEQLIHRRYIKRRLEEAAEVLEAASTRLARRKKLTGAEAQAIFNAVFEEFIQDLTGADSD